MFSMNTSNYITLKQAVKLLPISEWKLRELCKAGELPHYRIGHKYLFKPTEIEAYITQCKAV